MVMAPNREALAEPWGLRLRRRDYGAETLGMEAWTREVTALGLWRQGYGAEIMASRLWR